jgi:hypothetical protein
MKSLIVTALLLALGAAAVAKPAPVEGSGPALANNTDININIDTAPASRERDYFQASQMPQLPFTAGGLPCRLQPSIFDKTRLAQTCR